MLEKLSFVIVKKIKFYSNYTGIEIRRYRGIETERQRDREIERHKDRADKVTIKIPSKAPVRDERRI